jgi:hypothetical protein
MATALTPIAWQSLASNVTSVTLSSIPGTYRDLRLVITPKAITSAFTLGWNVNGDAGSNYYEVYALGTGSTTASGTSSANSGFYFNYAQAELTNASVFTFDFLDYAATDKHKAILVRGSDASSGVEMRASRWASTAAITSLVFAGGTFAAGSTFALYGVGA